VAQRLVRINCTHCVQDHRPDAQTLEAAGILDAGAYLLRTGRGCAHCRGTGFKGRKAVAEVLILDDELRELIVTREPVRRIKEVAFQKGTRSLREAGMQLVRSGATSLEELNRVVS
jgi:general secretion pathway protein E